MLDPEKSNQDPLELLVSTIPKKSICNNPILINSVFFLLGVITGGVITYFTL